MYQWDYNCSEVMFFRIKTDIESRQKFYKNNFTNNLEMRKIHLENRISRRELQKFHFKLNHITNFPFDKSRFANTAQPSCIYHSYSIHLN